MKSCFTAVFCLFILAGPASPTHPLTVQGVDFSDNLQAGSGTLRLHNAALLRYMKVLKAYVAALYLPEGTAPEGVLADVPKRLEISYLVPIKGGDFAKGADPVLARQHAPAELGRLRGSIERLHAAYRDVKAGDRYALTYLPGRGTELTLNGQPLVVIEGPDFASAYFGIWLGRDPIDAKLKRDLLEVR
jgi:hypothetical protein